MFRCNQCGAGTSEGVKNDVLGFTGILDGPDNQINWLHSRVQIILLRFVVKPHIGPDRGHRTNSAVEDRLTLIIRSTQRKGVLDPDDKS